MWIVWRRSKLLKVVGFRHAIAPPSPCPTTTTTTPTERHWRRTLASRRWECMEIFRAGSASGFNLGKASLSLIAARERRPKAQGARGHTPLFGGWKLPECRCSCCYPVGGGWERKGEVQTEKSGRELLNINIFYNFLLPGVIFLLIL